MKILVIHGPNLNLLGRRETGIYGTETLRQINERIRGRAEARGDSVEILQTNHEGEIVDAIHRAAADGPGKCDALVINPGAYAHYSISIRDAIMGTGLAAIEVHISNIHAREEFRRTSVVAGACRGQIAGLGATGYLLAIDALEAVVAPGRD